MSVPVSPYCLRHAIGDVIKERYTIRAVLGAGAFGTVYRVEESLGSRTLTLACKEMHVLSDPQTSRDERVEALQMFQDEAYVLQTLRHPHIPAAYFEPERGVWLACPVCGKTFKGQKNCPDHGAALQVVRDRFYLMMDFIEGQDLEEILVENKRPLDEDRVLDYALQVCDSLRAVHAKGLSHRDIKPANIKIQKDTDQAMLIDFGLVKPSAVAGGYGTVLKKGSTGLGTLGYAPESAEEQAHPDARTDILALGMTLYRLLCDLDPTEPNELAQMRAKNPNDFNLNLSDGTNAIIRKMIAFAPKDRYADVAALQQDLRAARYPVEVQCPVCGHVHRVPVAPPPGTPCERCGRPLPAEAAQNAPPNANNNGARAASPAKVAASTAGSKRVAAVTPSSTRSAPTLPRGNPYEARLKEIRRELDLNAAPQTHPNDARVSQIEAQFTALSHQATPGNGCPGCRTRDLSPVTAQPNGNCPLCVSAKIERRTWDENLCAICREGHLHAQHLKGDAMFCAVCHTAVLREEHRRKLGGFLDDLWGICPNCESSFDIRGHNARLESFARDPFGIGTLHKGRTLPVAQWKQLSTRSDNYCECDSCHAQWDSVDETQWKLARAGNHDPFHVGAQWIGKTLPRDDWGKMAAGLPFPSGNVFCPTCRAEWNYDQGAQTLQLLRSETPLPDWAKQWDGKSSGRAGWVCTSCHTEFDSEKAEMLKLVKTASVTLKPHVNQALTLRDWQRRGLNLPTESEARVLKGELQRLQNQRQADMTNWQQGQSRQRAQRQEEWNELLKLSVVGGHIPFRRLSAQAPTVNGDNYVALRNDSNRITLRASEELRWGNSANLCISQVSWSGYQWSRAGSGSLVVTSERLLFSARGSDAPWQCAIAQVRSAETQLVQGALLVVISLYNTPQLIGFEIGDARFETVYEGKSYNVALSPLHLATLIKTLRIASS